MCKEGSGLGCPRVWEEREVSHCMQHTLLLHTSRGNIMPWRLDSYLYLCWWCHIKNGTNQENSYLIFYCLDLGLFKLVCVQPSTLRRLRLLQTNLLYVLIKGTGKIFSLCESIQGECLQVSYMGEFQNIYAKMWCLSKCWRVHGTPNPPFDDLS